MNRPLGEEAAVAAPGLGSVQAAGACDVALLAELNRLCFHVSEGEGFVGAPWSARSLAEVLALPGAFGLLASEGDQPVGFLLGQSLFEEAEVLSLGVLAGRRRAGHGRRLLTAATAEAARRGARRLQLEVAEDNRIARTFYEALGFVLAGRRRNYYLTPDGRTLDALLFARPLASAAPAAEG